jgi:serine/threonine protein kinase
MLYVGMECGTIHQVIVIEVMRILTRLVAMKQLSSKEDMKEFKREATMLSTLSHPNIVQVNEHQKSALSDECSLLAYTHHQEEINTLSLNI